MNKYINLKNQLKNLIDTLDAHEILPSHHTIIEQYKVSDTTVRKALWELEKEGLIYTHHGKGRFVSPKLKFYPEIFCVFDGLDIMDDPNISDYIFPTLIDLLSKEFLKNDYEMLLSLYKDNPEYERQILQRLPDKKPYGTIFLYSGIEENIPYYKQAIDINPNVVFVDRKIEGINASFVGTDNYQATKDMIETIKDELFDQVFVIGNYRRKITTVDERTKGYLDALQETVNKDRIISLITEDFLSSYSEEVSKIILETIHKHKKICICFDNSYLFRQFYKKHKKEIKKLDYLKVICFDMPYRDPLKNVSFTYAKQNLPKIAKETVRILKENNKTSEEIRIKAKIFHIN